MQSREEELYSLNRSLSNKSILLSVTKSKVHLALPLLEAKAGKKGKSYHNEDSKVMQEVRWVRQEWSRCRLDKMRSSFSIRCLI